MVTSYGRHKPANTMTMPYGVTGNTAVFGTAIPGSNPGGAAKIYLLNKHTAYQYTHTKG
jgi:hypothetical protein